MNRLLYLGLLLTTAAQAQRIPSFGINKVRITEPNGTIVTELSTDKETHLHADRLYYWYNSNHIHTTQGGYSGKLLDGVYQEFYANKSLKEQGSFRKGLKEGVWKSWQENGTLSELATWHEGSKDGDFILFDNEGNPRQTGKYANNLLNGKVRVYHGKDSVETIKYKAGRVVANTLETPSLWQKVKAIKWKQKAISGDSLGIKTPKLRKVKKQKGKDTLLRVN